VDASLKPVAIMIGVLPACLCGRICMYMWQLLQPLVAGCNCMHSFSVAEIDMRLCNSHATGQLSADTTFTACTAMY
jgi:hypothetical protein